jgi:hypothetical protein
VAVAQALVPLQELMLKHLPDSPADALIGAIANMVAAAAANATPETFLTVLIKFPLFFMLVFAIIFFSNANLEMWWFL